MNSIAIYRFYPERKRKIIRWEPAIIGAFKIIAKAERRRRWTAYIIACIIGYSIHIGKMIVVGRSVIPAWIKGVKRNQGAYGQTAGVCWRHISQG